jgi:hypothetical protein
VGVKKTRDCINNLRQMGYLVCFVSETGEEISFIRKDIISDKM